MKTGRTLIRRYEPDQRDDSFWRRMGPMFASKFVRRELPYMGDDGYTWFVSLDGDEVAAFVAASIAGETATIHHYYTAPAHRKRGHMRRLTVDCLEWLAKQQVAMVNTIATQSCSGILKKEFGFVVDGERGSYRKMHLDLAKWTVKHKKK